ncbi:MAG: hypothetical protein LAT65_16655 [Saccharospirillum sp.]|nr:hypothetical protein [Saccharospirillum sp.]
MKIWLKRQGHRVGAKLPLGLAAYYAGNRRQRGSNPECYASYIGDIRNITSFDGRCPPI